MYNSFSHFSCNHAVVEPTIHWKHVNNCRVRQHHRLAVETAGTETGHHVQILP